MEENKEINKSNKINYIGFNYDYSYFCLGTDIGFQVYQTNPLTLLITKILNGGIGVVKILDKTNIFGLVGGGKNPYFSPNVLIFWDDKKDEIVKEYKCNSFIINCYIKQNYAYIICADNIIILKTKTLELIEIINTINNPKGIFSICNDPKKNIFAFPDTNKGNIIIKNFDNIIKENKGKEIEKEREKEYKDKKCNIIIKNAHKGNINILCFNFSGSKLASSSDRGTVIRIFNAESGELISELRRGNTDANIFSLCFSFNDNYLGLTSDHFTCHIFDLKNLKQKSKESNKGYVMSYISGVGKFFSNSQNSYSWRKFEVPKKERNIIGFTKDNDNICYILDKNGNFLSANITEEEPKINQKKLI